MTSPCNVCGRTLGAPAYRSRGGASLTSLCEIEPGETEVFFCETCGHLQTTEMANIDAYYDKTYRILIDSEEEDQLYEVRDGEKVYRVDHQAHTLLSKVELPERARVLDYGCAKGATLRRLCEGRDDVLPHLFDVSEMYIPFWQRFAAPENWATYEPRKEWKGRFDLITSFFALEHLVDLASVLGQVRTLLAPRGLYYFIVPNVFTNVADYVVIDHVNHFTRTSLEYLLQRAGMEAVEIDGDAHRGAFVVVARVGDGPTEGTPDPREIAALRPRVDEIGELWSQASDGVQAFEREHADATRVAIYGSGFYGSFIFSRLEAPDRVACFLDQNPFQQGKDLFAKPIIAPEEIPDEIDVVYVGLNPAIARSNIEAIPGWKSRRHRYYYL